MDKKLLLIILLVVIVIILGFSMYSNNNEQEKFIHLENTSFKIPDGYFEGKLTDAGHFNLTNGSDSVFITSYNSDNVDEYIDNYVNGKTLDNISVSVSNFTLDDILVYKAVNNEDGACHVWFVKNNNVYSIYSTNKNSKMDTIVVELINSMDISN